MRMDAIEFERRLRALARREGITFSTLVSLPAADRGVLVATIARMFDAGSVYRERDVNDALRAWLSGAGAMLETDHVNVRRWLVDTGVLARTPDCAEYRLAVLPDEAARIAAEPAIEALDATRIVADTREAMAAERARRKAQWLASERSGERADRERAGGPAARGEGSSSSSGRG